MLRAFTARLLLIPLFMLFITPVVVAGETVTVIAKDYKFQPEAVTVKAGTTVRWENQESRQYHSVWFESLGGPEGDYFFPGEHRERTFNEPGTYEYICEPHFESHQMKGVVEVIE